MVNGTGKKFPCTIYTLKVIKDHKNIDWVPMQTNTALHKFISGYTNNHVRYGHSWMCKKKTLHNLYIQATYSPVLINCSIIALWTL